MIITDLSEGAFGEADRAAPAPLLKAPQSSSNLLRAPRCSGRHGGVCFLMWSVCVCARVHVWAPQGFLSSERVCRMVQVGGCSASDFREVFKKNIERRVRSLPEIDGLSKETVLSSWMAKFDAIYRGEEDLHRQPQRMLLSTSSELILSKEQLYHMFQQILGIRKLEHQLLYNACQVGLSLLLLLTPLHP